MTAETESSRFAEAIERYFGSGRCFLFAKGRVALYAGLRALGLKPGSKVLMPGYTCMVVPSAVQFAGLHPLYIDIDSRSYNISPNRLEQIDAEGISALIVQHTYGIPCDMAPLMQWAASRGVAVIEDCCHVFGSTYHGRLCGSFGQFAFMSGQWNKPFSTGLGGMLLVNDTRLVERVENLVRVEAVAPGLVKNLFLRAQLMAFGALVRPTTAMKMTSLYRSLNRLGLAVGSSSQRELRGEMPPRYLARMAACQARQGAREMARIEANLAHRKRLTAFYHDRLPGIGFSSLAIDSVVELPLLRYPVRVANKSEVLSRAAAGGVEISSWFDVPLHPAGTCMEDLGYRSGTCPEAEAASREVVNLPTHRRVSLAEAERTLQFLQKEGKPAS